MTYFARSILNRAVVVFVAAVLLCASALPAAADTPKYVFLFIGDGMGLAQVHAADRYLAQRDGDLLAPPRLQMLRMSVHGHSTTHSRNSAVTDSAAAGTALATGRKTANGAIAGDPDTDEHFESIATAAKRHGMKVGILSSVSIDHATPAVFYAHQPRRSMAYEIGLDLVKSGFDFFGGGTLSSPGGGDPGKPDLRDMLREKGYTFAAGRADLEALTPEDLPVLATATVLEGAALPYEMDRPESEPSLADFTAAAIRALDNPDGFFIMVEGGRIDWACHANDAAATIHDTIAFDKAVGLALDFLRDRPDDTLVIVTADHETGGMTFGAAGYGINLSVLDAQSASHLAFVERLKAYGAAKPERPSLDDFLPAIREVYGLYVPTDADADAADKALHLTPYDVAQLEEAFAVTIGAREIERERVARYYSSPSTALPAALNQMISRKAGIGWTTFSHTGLPVPVFAEGAGQERFDGYYDNTDIAIRLRELITARAAEPLPAIR